MRDPAYTKHKYRASFLSCLRERQLHRTTESLHRPGHRMTAQRHDKNNTCTNDPTASSCKTKDSLRLFRYLRARHEAIQERSGSRAPSVLNLCTNIDERSASQIGSYIYAILRGTAVAQWLRCCATNRNGAGSIPDGVIGIFH